MNRTSATRGSVLAPYVACPEQVRTHQRCETQPWICFNHILRRNSTPAPLWV